MRSLRFTPSLAILILLALLAGTSLWTTPAAAHPGPDTLALATPYGRVTITRDAAGVPFIRARGEDGAQFGLGYAHTQDRLWQMEWQRRLGAGRTAELRGPDGLAADTLFRTIGVRRSAEAAWAALSPTESRPIAAYAAGINAFSPMGGLCRPSSPSSASSPNPGRAWTCWP